MGEGELSSGRVILGRFRLDRELGHGGMGTVWAATHTVTGKSLALKFLKASSAGDETARRRFVREARSACAVRHPHVVSVHDVIELDDGAPVMVIILQVLSALEALHAQGIVHRDLKPDTVFLCSAPGVRGEAPRLRDREAGASPACAPRKARIYGRSRDVIEVRAAFEEVELPKPPLRTGGGRGGAAWVVAVIALRSRRTTSEPAIAPFGNTRAPGNISQRRSHFRRAVRVDRARRARTISRAGAVGAVVRRGRGLSATGTVDHAIARPVSFLQTAHCVPVNPSKTPHPACFRGLTSWLIACFGRRTL